MKRVYFDLDIIFWIKITRIAAVINLFFSLIKAILASEKKIYSINVFISLT